MQISFWAGLLLGLLVGAGLVLTGPRAVERLALNARAPGEGYTLDLPHLAAGALVELELTRFTARDGSSFTPHTAKAFLLSLEADTPHGRGVWSGRID
jgi:hypothetical protein